MTTELLEVDGEKVLKERGVYLNLSGSGERPLRWGEETMFINASIMNVHYKPINAPWIIDLDLPMKQNDA